MTTTTMTKIKPQTTAAAESIINDAPRLLESFEVGDVSYQGDLIIVRIADLPKSAQPRSNRQLVEGNTQGSRHVLKRGTVYDCEASEVAAAIKAATKCDVQLQYIGPVFVSPANPTANDLEHPEHGNQGFPSRAVCAVVYQRSLDAEKHEQRVRD